MCENRAGKGRSPESGAEPDETGVLSELLGRVPGFSIAVMRDHAGCILLLTPSGRISFLNRAGRALFEVDDLSQLAGRDWWEMWPPENHDMVRLAVSRAAGREPVSFEAVCPTLRGRRLWWDVKVTPLVNGEGAVESLLVNMTDLTARYGTPDSPVGPD